MKREFKTITAIATIINQHTEYISGQSVREDGKYIPQFNQRTVHAKEFVEYTDEEGKTITAEQDAQNYIARIHNPYHRVYDIVTIEIPVIKDLKKYDRQVKRETARTVHGRTLPVKELFIILLVALLITSCSQYTCPSINGGKEPRDKTKRMTVSYKTLKDGKYLVTERKGFNTTVFITDCKPCR